MESVVTSRVQLFKCPVCKAGIGSTVALELDMSTVTTGTVASSEAVNLPGKLLGLRLDNHDCLPRMVR